jgi:plastocyanin
VFRPRILALLLLTLTPQAIHSQVTSVLTLLPTDGRRLTVGSEYTGALSAADFMSLDDRYLEAWSLEGRAGQNVTVDLLSDSFDPTVYVVGPGFPTTQWSDDGAGGCNARLSVTLLEDGTYTVVASAYSGETGTYILRVSDQPGPAPSYGCGEMDPEAIAQLPVDGRSLRVGGLAAGVLGTASRIVQDGRPGEAWELTAEPGQRVSIILESTDFDAYLYLTGPGLTEILTDDDGAGDLNSRIDVTLPDTGPYTVVASALGAGEFGAYIIRVEEAAPLDELPIDGGMVDLGATVQGRLGLGAPVILEGRPGQVWGLDATAGQRAVIDLRSDDFDTYLYVVGPGILEPLSDDDGGNEQNSQLTVTFPETGTYRIIASAYSPDTTGSFTITVTGR